MTYSYPPQYAYPSAPPMYRALPAPPRLHWAIVCLLSFVTSGVFGMVWLLVEAHWVKKATRNAKPFWWCLAYLLSLPAIYLVLIFGAMMTAILHQQESAASLMLILVALIAIASFVLYLVAAYTLKGALEAEPTSIPLSGVMTFFFAPTYFQYHLFDYNVEGIVAEQLTGFAEPALAGATAVMDVPEVPPQA